MNILLTGATGFIGRCVLRELLLRGHRVTAVVRGDGTATGDQRLRTLMRRNGWPQEWNRSLEVIEADLNTTLSAHPSSIEACDQVIHCAAALNFDRDRNGDPWRTNVDGTVQLGQLVASCGVRKFLYVSTAYVCGRHSGPIFESHCGEAEARNDYETSKQAAERWLVQDSGLDWTMVRPGIVVGDSRTGFTSHYFGMYRVLKSIARLCERLPVSSDGTRHLPLRLPFSGNERNHLIPVDFVGSAIADLALRDDVAQKCVHLTPDQPTTTATLLEAIQTFHHVRGIELVGTDGIDTSPRNVFERIFDRETQIVGQYFEDDPTFDTTQRQQLLANFPTQPVDVSMLLRLQAFGQADCWGDATPVPESSDLFDCVDFFTRHFPAAAADSQLEEIPGLSAVVRFEIEDAANGYWLCLLEHGRVIQIAQTTRHAAGADFQYRTDAAAFHRIVAGELNVRQAFFDRRIRIDGDIERALLLAVLFEDLLQETPYCVFEPSKTSHAVATENACA